MIINRHLLPTLQSFAQLEVVLLWGPRQVGKTTLLDLLPLKSRLFLDDLGLRQRAQTDPALVLDDAELPCLIDEAQYAPELFPEIKLRVDRLRRELRTTNQPAPGPLYFLTGSNRSLLDGNIKESLAGRSHNFILHGLSVKEILASFPETPLKTILFRGGLPELYVRENLTAPAFLNDYILSFVEKDIARSAGIEKLAEFHTVLRLLAARTGQFIQPAEIAAAAGVDQKSVRAWMGVLQKNGIIELLTPYSTHLSKRVVRMSKLHFMDTGLCSRLQGHLDPGLLWNSPQVGGLFETLAFSEIVKTRDNFLRDWRVHTWRTKEKHEIDCVLEWNGGVLLIEAKLAVHGARPFELDPEARKVFSTTARKIVVTSGGEITRLDRETTQVPIRDLGTYLLSATA